MNGDGKVNELMTVNEMINKYKDFVNNEDMSSATRSIAAEIVHDLEKSYDLLSNKNVLKNHSIARLIDELKFREGVRFDEIGLMGVEVDIIEEIGKIKIEGPVTLLTVID